MRINIAKVRKKSKPLSNSERLRRVKSTNTLPERRIRDALTYLGIKFKQHVSIMPGKPDFVLEEYPIILFVHGCFWHRHPHCRLTQVPKTRREYWLPKFERNVVRDRLAKRALRKAGWVVATVWECQTNDPALLLPRLLRLTCELCDS